MDAACAKQAKAIGFASVLTIGDNTEPKSWKHHGKGKGKKKARVAMALVGVAFQLYTSLKLPSSRDTHFNVMAVGLEATNAVPPSSLYANLMLPLVAILDIFRAMLVSPSIAL